MSDSLISKGDATMDQEKIGKFIADCRKEKGLTQMQLSEQLGITNRAISKWCKLQYQNAIKFQHENVVFY